MPKQNERKRTWLPPPKPPAAMIWPSTLAEDQRPCFVSPMQGRFILGAIALAAFVAAAAAPLSGARAAEPTGLHEALKRLSDRGEFSGAVVLRGPQGTIFARGYGKADPFVGHPFSPYTSVDSGSLAKPVTAAGVLILARDGKIDLEAPVQRYLPEYPHAEARVRHLLAHSAGLAGYDRIEPIAGKSNLALLEGMRAEKIPASFAPGTAFAYCNSCYDVLALLIERVAGMPYVDFCRRRIGLPASVRVRPAALRDWTGRAIGFRRGREGKLERADSYEGEAFYGSANLSLSAEELARWGEQWFTPTLGEVRALATTAAEIAGRKSGLTWGSWYCAPSGAQCHYLGHHEGFHHMLYWDAARRLSIAMVSNNSLAPQLQMPLQRALVAFAEGQRQRAERELANLLPRNEASPGTYRMETDELLRLQPVGAKGLMVRRGGVGYAAYPIGAGIRYVPGLDAYIAASTGRDLRWLTLYENIGSKP